MYVLFIHDNYIIYFNIWFTQLRSNCDFNVIYSHIILTVLLHTVLSIPSPLQFSYTHTFYKPYCNCYANLQRRINYRGNLFLAL